MFREETMGGVRILRANSLQNVRSSQVVQNEGETDRQTEDSSGVICFAGVDWWYHNRAHSDVQLMMSMSEERTVLLVNSIGMRMPLPGRSTMPFRRILRKAFSMLRFVRRPLKDKKRFIVMTPIMIPFFGVRLLRTMNFAMIRWQVTTVAGLFGVRNPHLFVTVPTAIEVCRGMRCQSLSYNRSDVHSAFHEADREYIRKLEDELLEMSDVVFYSSRSLMRHETEKVGKRAHFLDHGLDIDLFSQSGDVRELTMRKPVIGFFGGLDDYIIDFELLEKLAESFREADIVLIGDATLPLKALQCHSNIILPGYRPYESIPAYGRAFDVAIMPWLQNEWIRYSNPIKLKEYLSLGLEIVTMYFPEAEHYEEHVHIAHSHDEFIGAVSSVLSGSLSKLDLPARRTLLATASWSNRAQECIFEMEKGALVRCAE